MLRFNSGETTNQKQGGEKMINKVLTNPLSLVLLATAIILTPVKAMAQEETPKTVFGDFLKEKGIEVTGGGTLDFYDKYVWRGQYLDTDAVVQPGFSLSSKGFTVGYWGSLPLEKSDALNSDESDFYIAYAYTLMPDSAVPVTLSAGHTWYQFPAGPTSSKEFSFGVALGTLLAPSFTYYHDYEDGKDLNNDGSGNYYVLGISHSLPIVPEYNISLELAMQYGYIDGQWLNGTGSHLTPTIGLKVPLMANLTVTPTIGYNITMGDLEDENIANQESKFFGGVKSSYTF